MGFKIRSKLSERPEHLVKSYSECVQKHMWTLSFSFRHTGTTPSRHWTKTFWESNMPCGILKCVWLKVLLLDSLFISLLLTGPPIHCSYIRFIPAYSLHSNILPLHTLTTLFVRLLLPIFIINLEKGLTAHRLQGKHSFNLLTWEAVRDTHTQKRKKHNPLKDFIPNGSQTFTGAPSSFKF